MKYKVEKNIPIPQSLNGRGMGDLALSFVGQIKALKKGESILVSDKSRAHVSVTTTMASKNTSHKYTTRSVDGGIRIWRVS